MICTAHNPSRFGIKVKLTINWKSLLASLAFEKDFDDEKSTKSHCILLWNCCLNLTVKTYLTINWNILFEFRLVVRKPTSADELYWELSVATIGCSAKGPGYWQISADGCISAVAFNAVFAELIFVIEVTGSNANNVKAWRETFVVEDTWTFTTRDWTILDDNPYWNEQIVEMGSRADEKLCGLAERKCAGECWFVMVVDWRNPLELRCIGVVWELLVVAIGWLISSSLPDQSAKDSRWLLWLESTALLICERLFGSSASESIRLVGLRVGLFVGLLIGSTKWNHWFSWTWFPATGLRLVNAFALLAKRKSASSTKKFKRASITFILFLQLLFNKFF